ncbi:hypothetical protein CEQ90_05180 [Lewinellaceae bacterium SD302]|nr:hypothetical protein CEQ90_05180 [Lewinellaceae bacterium SD302]
MLINWLVVSAFTTTHAETIAKVPSSNGGDDIRVMLIPDFPTLSASLAAARDNETYRILIRQLSQVLIDREFVVLDLIEQAQVQRNRSLIYGSEISIDPFTMFCNFAPSEIFIYVKAQQITHETNDYQLSFSLKAIDKYAYENLASSANFKSFRRRHLDIEQQCASALRETKKLEAFCDQLIRATNKLKKSGCQVFFRADIDDAISLTFDTNISEETLTTHLLRILRGPLQDKAIGQPRKSPNVLEFTISMPPMRASSVPYTIMDYGLDVQADLKRLIASRPVTVQLKVVKKFISLHLLPKVTDHGQH